MSRDEEYVRLYGIRDRLGFDMGARSHNYLLLTLARRRVSDRAEGFPETACGWIDLEDLSHDESMTAPRVNLDVFRIRRQFGAVQLAGPEIIERRPRNRQIRIGVRRIAVSLV